MPCRCPCGNAKADIAPNTVGNLAKAHLLPALIVNLATLGKVCAILEIEPGDVLKLGD